MVIGRLGDARWRDGRLFDWSRKRCYRRKQGLGYSYLVHRPSPSLCSAHETWTLYIQCSRQFMDREGQLARVLCVY